MSDLCLEALERRVRRQERWLRISIGGWVVLGILVVWCVQNRIKVSTSEQSFVAKGFRAGSGRLRKASSVCALAAIFQTPFTTAQRVPRWRQGGGRIAL
jgi:hypothetical protein